MQSYEGDIYILDTERRDIVRFTEEFDSIHYIGHGGAGPQELNIPSRFFIEKDTIYLTDTGGSYIKCITDDTISSLIKLPHLALDKRFFYVSDHFYIPSITDNSLFMAFNKAMEQDTVRYGGEIVTFQSKKRTLMQNARHLLVHGNTFYAVSDNLPQIQRYDLHTLDLLEEFDLSQMPVIKQNLNYISSRENIQNSFSVFIEDAYLANNSLYLLCAELGMDYKVNKLIKISLSPMRITDLYILPGNMYESFCVSSHYIFAFDSEKGTIDRIKLND